MDRVNAYTRTGGHSSRPLPALPFKLQATFTNETGLAVCAPNKTADENSDAPISKNTGSHNLTHLRLAVLDQIASDAPKPSGVPRMTHTYSYSSDTSSSGWSAHASSVGLSPFVPTKDTSIWNYSVAEAPPVHTSSANMWAGHSTSIWANDRAPSPRTALFQATPGALYPKAIDDVYSAAEELAGAQALVRVAPHRGQQAVLSPPRSGSPEEATFYQTKNAVVAKQGRWANHPGAIGAHRHGRARIQARKEIIPPQGSNVLSNEDSPIASPASLAEMTAPRQVHVSTGYSLAPDLSQSDAKAFPLSALGVPKDVNVGGIVDDAAQGSGLPFPVLPLSMTDERQKNAINASFVQSELFAAYMGFQPGDPPSQITAKEMFDLMTGTGAAQAVPENVVDEHDRGITLPPQLLPPQLLPPEHSVDPVLTRQDFDDDEAKDTPMSIFCERVLAPHALVQFSGDERMRSWDTDTCLAQIKRFKTRQLDWHYSFF